MLWAPRRITQGCAGNATATTTPHNIALGPQKDCTIRNTACQVPHPQHRRLQAHAAAAAPPYYLSGSPSTGWLIIRKTHWAKCRMLTCLLAAEHIITGELCLRLSQAVTHKAPWHVPVRALELWHAVPQTERFGMCLSESLLDARRRTYHSCRVTLDGGRFTRTGCSCTRVRAAAPCDPARSPH